MAFKRRFSDKDVDDIIRLEFLEEVDRNILSIFHRVGEEFVVNARSALKIDTTAFPSQRIDPKTKRMHPPGEYVDQTANLRNSIGYAVIKDRTIIYENFISPQGRAIAEKLTRLSVGNKYVLIGMAGMEYASYLESMGYNVISSQSLVAVVDLSDRLRALTEGKPIDIGATSSNISSKL